MIAKDAATSILKRAATAEVKAAFQKHGQELVEALLALTKSEDERVRLGAINACLDRGFGKAVQHLEAEVSVYDSLSLAEQQALLAALDALDAADEPEPASATPPQGRGRGRPGPILT